MYKRVVLVTIIKGYQFQKMNASNQRLVSSRPVLVLLLKSGTDSESINKYSPVVIPPVEQFKVQDHTKVVAKDVSAW